MAIQVATANDLDTLVRNSANWGQDFIQTADIDLSAYNWIPIGSDSFASDNFHGTYDIVLDLD